MPDDPFLPTAKTKLRHSTYDGYERGLRLHVYPVLGGVRLQQLRHQMLTDLYTALLTKPNPRGSGLSAKTIRLIHTTIRKALSDAVRWGVVEQNVAALAEPPKVKRVEIDMTDARVWDTSAIVALDAVVAKFAERDIEAVIVGLNRHAAELHSNNSGKVSAH